MRRLGALFAAFQAVGLVSGQARSEFEDVISETQKRVFPAVVFVKPVQESYAVGAKRKVLVYGSGVIISPEGLVVTNQHVAEKALEIRCVLSDKREVHAEVVGQDRETDLAVLKLELSGGETVPYVPLGNSKKLKEGEFVLAMGAPFGFVRSVSLGIVSNTRRCLSSSPYNLWIQTDAAINPGNSGGPLVNIEGEVVGINTRGIFRAENIGFAIPADCVREVVKEISEHGRVPRSWTGIALQPLKDFERSVYIDAKMGVMVASVDKGSPAEKAGLRSGDRIVRISGRETTGLYRESLPEIRRFLAGLPSGQPVAVEFVREGRKKQAKLTPVAKGRVEGEDLELKEWDVTLKQINRHRNPLLAYFRPAGVFVQGVESGGNADRSGLKRGDILLKLDGETVGNLRQAFWIYQRANTLPNGKRKVLCELLRGGYRRWIGLEFNRRSKKQSAEETLREERF